MGASSCLSPGQLEDYLLGRIPESLALDYEAHLEQCAICRALIEQCDESHDPLIRMLRQPKPASYEHEPGLQRAMEELRLLESWAQQLAEPQRTDDLKQIEPGARLRDYMIQERIGVGAMGTVYRALHLHLQRQVAIKVLSCPRLASHESSKMGCNEDMALGRINHPNVVYATDAGEENGWKFLVMEYVDGCNLAQLVKDVGPFPYADACEIIRQAAEGLRCAHQHDLVHRDIKPSNLMLSKEGIVKVLDLGLASRRVQEDSSDRNTIQQKSMETVRSMNERSYGSVLGTVDYMSPEQALNPEDADERSDIYSLGCTLHYLLTGLPPFSGKDDLQILRAHKLQPAPCLAEHRPDCPTQIQAIFECMVAKPRGNRLRSMADVVRRLDSLILQLDAVAEVPVAGTSEVGQLHLENLRRNRLARAVRKRVRRVKPSYWLGIPLAMGLAVLAIGAAWRMTNRAADPMSDPVPESNVVDQHLQMPDGTGELRLLTTTPNESVVAAIVSDEQVLVWETKGGQIMHKIHCETPLIRAITMSPKGDILVIGTNNGCVRVWNLIEEYDFELPNPHSCAIQSLAISRDGQWIACGNQSGQLTVWDANNRELLWTEAKCHDGGISALTFDPSGERLASGGQDRHIRLWVRARKQLERYWLAHDGAVNCLAFCHSGQILASGGDDDALKIWTKAGVFRNSMSKSIGSGYSTLSFDGDDLLLATSSRNGLIQLWDWEAGKICSTLSDPNGVSVSFRSTNQHFVVTSSSGRTWEHDVSPHLDEIEGRRRARAPLPLIRILQGHQSRATTLAFAADGTLYSGSDDRTVKAWNTQTGDLLYSILGHGSYVQGLAVVEGDRKIVTASNDAAIRLWSADNQELLNCLHLGSDVLCVAATQRHFVCGCGKGTVWIGDLKTAMFDRNWVAHSSAVLQAKFSRNGLLLATGSADGAVVWRWDMTEVVAALPGVFVIDLEFTPDGKELLTADSDGQLCFWDLDSGTLRRRISAHLAAIGAISISPDGKWLATGCRDGILKLWDFESMEVITSHQAHTGSIRDIEFAPTGGMLASCGHDSLVKLWAIPPNLVQEAKKRAAEWGRYPTTRSLTPRGARFSELSVY